MNILIVLPDQLWQIKREAYQKVFLVYDPRYFKKFQYHKIKIAYHFATCSIWAKQYNANIVENQTMAQTIIDVHNTNAGSKIFIYETEDPAERGEFINVLRSPGFLMSRTEYISYAGNKTSFHMTRNFYKYIKEKYIPWMLGVATVDEECRGGLSEFNKSGITLPKITKPRPNEEWKVAVRRTMSEYAGNPGELSEDPLYAMDRGGALKCLDYFVANKLKNFCAFQDLILKENHYLFHSVLSPMMNIGLITPNDIIVRIQKYINETNNKNDPNVEAFIRQICWREYMRMISTARGDEIRRMNFFNSHRRISPKWYTAQVGVEIIDNTIRQVIKTGYTHHIERLMILGSWMLMKGAEPHSAYKWFMEMFIDAYEWVMLPNVYGMALWACGPMITSRPYLSSSTYMNNMSDYSIEAKNQWNDGYQTFFREKGEIIQQKNIYSVSTWYNNWKAKQRA